MGADIPGGLDSAAGRANIMVRPVGLEDTMPDPIARHRDEVAELCRRYRVRRLYLFGSAVSGRFDPAASDLDFVVDFEELPQSAYADSYFGLLSGLEAVLGRPVDLVMASAIDNPYFQRRIAEQQTTVYAARD
jgi:uncharacterized protein